jgi:putative ABC transport system permease protein
VEAPPDPAQLRGQISTDTRNLLLALSFVTLVIGGVGIANTMLVAVLERRTEIGLRRALGAYSSEIVGLFLGEAAIIGTAGGMAGLAIGILAAAAMCASRGWSFALPAIIVGAPLLGSVVGITAGIYPAIRASKVDPADALRS